MVVDTQTSGLARGGAADIFALVRDVALPTLSKGVLRRRPGVVGLLESTGTEARGIQRLQRLRQKYASRPVLLSVFGRKQLILTDPAQVQRVLQETPAAFKSSSDEKSAALAHFEPGVSLIADGADRQVRRAFNAGLLDEGCPFHRLSTQFRQVVHQEFGDLFADMTRRGATNLTWEPFFAAWNRMVRQILLGDSARNDEALTESLNRLRSVGNWAFLHPGRKRLRHDFHHRLQTHLDRADPASLAGLVAQVPGHDQTPVSDQFAHYMFAFDPGGMTSYRALALLAAHPDTMHTLRTQLAAGDGRADPLLRASLLESLRLWPTTPVILRQARHDIDWEGDTLPGGAQVVIYAPFFHRDDETLTEAHRFAPGLWPDGQVGLGSRFVPFSDGDGVCPARDLVLMVGAMVLSEILGTFEAALADPARLDPARPLPPTLDNYTIEFNLTGRAPDHQS